MRKRVLKHLEQSHGVGKSDMEMADDVTVPCIAELAIEAETIYGYSIPSI